MMDYSLQVSLSTDMQDIVDGLTEGQCMRGRVYLNAAKNNKGQTN